MSKSIILCLVYSITTVASLCPNGFTHHDESCYKLFNTLRATWTEAQLYCKLFGGRLAIIESEREQKYLEGFLLNEYHPGMPDGVWIDGNDLQVEGEWMWTDTNQYIDGEVYTNWYPGEPNSIHKQGEDCMDLLHHEHYNWNDNVCSFGQSFLCEMSNGNNGGDGGNLVIGK